MEVEAVDDGEISEILVPAGTEGVKVNTPIARLKGGDAGIGTAPAAKPVEKAPEAKAPVQPRGDEDPFPHARTPLADPEIPHDAKLMKTTVRDALRDAMAEEMRRDPDVFLMGEEVAQYQGAYKVSRELLQEFRRPPRGRRRRSPKRLGFAGPRRQHRRWRG